MRPRCKLCGHTDEALVTWERVPECTVRHRSTALTDPGDGCFEYGGPCRRCTRYWPSEGNLFCEAANGRVTPEEIGACEHFRSVVRLDLESAMVDYTGCTVRDVKRATLLIADRRFGLPPIRGLEEELVAFLGGLQEVPREHADRMDLYAGVTRIVEGLLARNEPATIGGGFEAEV